MGDQANSLDLFSSGPAVAGDIVDTICSEIPPDVLDYNAKTLNFTIPPSATLFTDGQIRLLLRMKIEMDPFVEPVEGTTTEADKQGIVAWSPLIPATMFRAMTVSLNENLIQTSNDFSYLTYVLNLLMTSDSQKRYLEDTACFHLDSPGMFNYTAVSNVGFNKRREACLDGNMVEYVWDIPIYALLTNKFLIPGARMQFSFTHALDSHRLLCDKAAAKRNPRIKVEFCRMLIKRHLMSQTVTLHIHNELQTKDATYHFCRPVIKGPFSVPSGRRVVDLQISNGRKPGQILCFFVKSKSYLGSFEDNAFEFQHNKVTNFVAIFENNVSPNSYAAREYKFQTGTREQKASSFVKLAYMELQRMLGFHGRFDGWNEYSLSRYIDDSTIYGFDLSKSVPSRDFVPEIEYGALSIRIELEEELKTEVPYSLLVLAFFNDKISISKSLVTSTSFIPGAF